MKKEKRTFYRLYDNHKKQCDYIYEAELTLLIS